MTETSMSAPSVSHRSSFKDRLAAWTRRDSNNSMDGSTLDIVRVATRKNSLMRFGAKKRYSVTRRREEEESGVSPPRRASATSKASCAPSSSRTKSALSKTLLEAAAEVAQEEEEEEEKKEETHQQHQHPHQEEKSKPSSSSSSPAVTPQNTPRISATTNHTTMSGISTDAAYDTAESTDRNDPLPINNKKKKKTVRTTTADLDDQQQDQQQQEEQQEEEDQEADRTNHTTISGVSTETAFAAYSSKQPPCLPRTAPTPLPPVMVVEPNLIKTKKKLKAADGSSSSTTTTTTTTTPEKKWTKTRSKKKLKDQGSNHGMDAEALSDDGMPQKKLTKTRSKKKLKDTTAAAAAAAEEGDHSASGGAMSKDGMILPSEHKMVQKKKKLVKSKSKNKVKEEEETTTTTTTPLPSSKPIVIKQDKDVVKELAPMIAPVQKPATKPRVATTTTTTIKMRSKSIRAKPLVELKTAFAPPVLPKSDAVQTLIRNALANNFVFSKMTGTSLEQLVLAFESTESYPADHVIIQQGDVGDYFYVLSTGAVRFEVGGTTVGAAGAGASFGELALLYTSPRAATVRATEPTRLHRLDQTTFRYILQNQTKQSKAKKLGLLQKIDFFKDLAAADLQHICSVLTPRHFQPNECIVQKGDEGHHFYVIDQGTLAVTDITAGNTAYEDVTLGPGQYFGERALVKSEPRAANVIGVSAGTLFSIDRATFEKVCGNFVRLILKSQDKGRLSGVKLIQAVDLDSETLEELSQYLFDEMYRENKEIFMQGRKTQPALYLVREGQVRITYPSGEEKMIREGGYFGEDLLLADAKYGTVKEVTPRVEAKYTAVAVEANTVCGVLLLKDCRMVFDTKTIGAHIMDNEEEEIVGILEEEDEDEYKHIVGRRSSRRISVSTETLRKSMKMDTVLGEGQFGEVWQVSTDIEEMKENFALKIQSKEDTSRDGYSAMEAIQRECDILSSIDHPFVVDLVHHYEDEDNVYMMMGLLKGGDLWGVIHHEQDDGNWVSGIPEANAKFYSLIIADTLDYMHRQKLVFRDLKPENIMVDEMGYPIFVDFGFAKYLEDGMTYTFCGTPNYLAPEIVNNQGHGAAVDHWALGVMIYEMISGENPFFYEGIDQLTLFHDICNNEPYPLAEEVSQETKDLALRLMTKDPTERIGSLARGGKEIKVHGWFADIDLAKARNKEVPAPWLPTIS